MFKNHTGEVFEPFLCLRSDCIFHQGKIMDEELRKRREALSPDGELVKKLGTMAAKRWYDAGRKSIRICEFQWVTRGNDGRCDIYIKGWSDLACIRHLIKRRIWRLQGD
jgi:hypothetical protein